MGPPLRGCDEVRGLGERQYTDSSGPESESMDSPADRPLSEDFDLFMSHLEPTSAAPTQRSLTSGRMRARRSRPSAGGAMAAVAGIAVLALAGCGGTPKLLHSTTSSSAQVGIS